MGVDEHLKTGVDNFFAFETKEKITALFALPLAAIFVLSGTGSGYWSTKEIIILGLDQYCKINGTLTCCSSFPEAFGSNPAWNGGTFAFMILGTIFGCGTLVLTCLTMCFADSKVKFHVIVPVFSFITAFLLMIAVAIYADNYDSESWSANSNLSGSFFVTVIALLMYLLMGLFNLPFCNSIGVTNYYTPKTWTVYTAKKPIAEWIKESEGHPSKLIQDVTTEQEGVHITQLIHKLWLSNAAGVGRDAKEHGYKNIKVTSVKRIENVILFEKYLENRAKFKRRRHPMTKSKDLIGSRSEVKTTLNMNESLLKKSQLDLKVNEHYLFHGCDSEIANFITKDGLDLRLAANGMLGRGTYGAENPTKSDQYTGTGLTDKKLFLMRVILGDIYVANAAHQFRRPPCKKCIQFSTGNLDTCSDSSHNDQHDWNFDSVLYDKPTKHREFVVYDQHRCYPEYMITYDRLAG